jgi:hypothetical protein
MGGKGGGGGGGSSNWQAIYATDPKTGGAMRDASGNLMTHAAYAQQQSDEAAALAAANKPAPAPAAAAAAPAPEPAAPVVDTSPPKNDTLAPSIGGGSDVIADPAAPGGAGSGIDNAGSTLGGAVLKPPKYWTGNIDKYKPGSTSKGGGSMTTTQT